MVLQKLFPGILGSQLEPSIKRPNLAVRTGGLRDSAGCLQERGKATKGLALPRPFDSSIARPFPNLPSASASLLGALTQVHAWPDA